MAIRTLLPALVGLADIAATHALDNGLGLTPGSIRGWRSWNCFGSGVTQQKMLTQIDALVDRSRLVDGHHTSLLDLGYDHVGLDDAWQACGTGVNGSFHDKDGNPLVNVKAFPNMTAMNDYAHHKGVKSGWYLNNCICEESGQLRRNWLQQMQGDVDALIRYGYDSVKLDGCGPANDTWLWAKLINKTGKPILIENCGNTYPGSDSEIPGIFKWNVSGPAEVEDLKPLQRCPMNFYRSGTDGRSSWKGTLRNVNSQVPFLKVSQPGCWAYADMLEVGNPPGGFADDRSFENHHSWRANFALWAITSSPLILSFDLSDANKTDKVWDIITNRAVLEMNAAWAGEAGRLVQSFYNTSQSTALIAMPCSTDSTTQRWILDPNHTGAIQSADEDDGRCMEVPDCTPIDHNFGVTVGPCHVADVHANCSSRNQQWDLNTSTGYITSRMARPPSGSPYSVLNVYDMTGPAVQMFYPDPGAANEVFVYDTASQQLVNTEHAGGVKLCLDIDTSGLIREVEVLAQVWAKSLPDQQMAVLLLNADNATAPRTVAINVSKVVPPTMLRSVGRFDVLDMYNTSVPKLATVRRDGELRAELGPQDSALFLLKPAASEQ